MVAKLHIGRRFSSSQLGEDMYNKEIAYNDLPLISTIDIGNIIELSKLAEETRVSIEILNYAVETLINPDVFMDMLLQEEVMASCKIDRINIANDEIYKSILLKKHTDTSMSILNCKKAIENGFNKLDNKKGFGLSNIIDINNIVTNQELGIRNNLDGFTNDIFSIKGEDEDGKVHTIYTPPHGRDKILNLLVDMVEYVYDDEIYTYHPLIKIALAHYQFESIHPFKNGNGRTGRILNILFMCNKGYLESPVLNASLSLAKNRRKYYKLLESTHENGDYYEFIKFMLNSFNESAKETLKIVEGLKNLGEYFKSDKVLEDFKIGEKNKEVYDRIIKMMVDKPYLRISDLTLKEIGLHRQTAATILDKLATKGILLKIKIGRDNIYKNTKLIELFEEVING